MANGSLIGGLSGRAIQILSACVILGLSVWLAHEWSDFQKAIPLAPKAQRPALRALVSRWPSSSDYSAFVGAFGLLDALVGLIALFVSAIPLIAVMALDGLAAIFYLAGGINMAVLYGSVDCYGNICTKEKTDIAFQFIGLIATFVALALHFFAHRGSQYSGGGV